MLTLSIDRCTEVFSSSLSSSLGSQLTKPYKPNLSSLLHQPHSEMGRPDSDTAAQQSTLQQAQAATVGQTIPAGSMTHNVFLQQIDLNGPELTEDDPPPPAYGEAYGEIRDEKNGTGTSATITDDGRVNIRINHFNRCFSQIFTPALHQHL
jgi:hypothetical protein